MTDDDDIEDDTSGSKRDLTKPKSSEPSLPAAPRGLPTFFERIRAYGNRKYYEARKAEIEAHTGMTDALGDNLRSRRGLQCEVVESEEWDEERERERIRATYAREDIELNESLEEAKHEAELARLRREEELKQAKQRGKVKQQRPSGPSRLERFREDIEQLMETGTLGSFMAIAEEYRQELIAERGGEEHLTEKDKENIELAFEHARRCQESKG